MPLPKEILNEIHELQRKSGQWFSIPDIKERHRELFATEYIQQPTGQVISVPHRADDVYRKLDDHASRLLEHELRSYEVRIGELCASNSVVPSPEDDALVLNELTEYTRSSVEELSNEISAFTDHKPDEWGSSWSRLDETGKRIASELSVTLRLAGEIARLELIESGYEPLDRIGFSQTKIERFYSHYPHIPHPFDSSKSLELSQDELRRAVRLLVYVVSREVKEPRLRGFESKFVSAFSRYLACPRDSSSSAIEQIAALFEPFLKKLSLLFDVCDASGNPIWHSGLGELLAGLKLSSSNLKETDATYWQGRSVEEGVFRLAYQLRHKGAHEAHDYAYYERERNAYFVLAALLISCKIVMGTEPKVAEAIEHQGDVDALRDLFVKIDELNEGPDGPRGGYEPSPIPSRFQKLLAFSRRAQAIWPTCSAAPAEGLRSEYMSVKYELAEADREAEIESYLENMRADYDS